MADKVFYDSQKIRVDSSMLSTPEGSYAIRNISSVNLIYERRWGMALIAAISLIIWLHAGAGHNPGLYIWAFFAALWYFGRGVLVQIGATGGEKVAVELNMVTMDGKRLGKEIEAAIRAAISRPRQ